MRDDRAQGPLPLSNCGRHPAVPCEGAARHPAGGLVAPRRTSLRPDWAWEKEEFRPGGFVQS